LKTQMKRVGRSALNEIAAVAAVTAALCAAPSAWALGLGRLTVQSAVGEALRAEIDVTSLTPDEAANLRARVAPPESYRIAGVDYSSVLPSTSVILQRRPDGSAFLRISSDRAVQEPFVDVILELNWASGRLLREYTLLFDPPASAKVPSTPAPGTLSVASSSAPAPSPAPVIAPAPAPAATSGTVAAPVKAAPKVAPVVKPEPAAKPAAAKPSDSAADEYRVKAGDSLSRIAAKLQPSGVSLDQMLVGLYRGNEAAFVGKNMNRLRSGVVLNVPSSDQLAAVDGKEARQVINAQSADFNNYRQRLAKGVPTRTEVEEPARKTTGKVQAEVEDRKQGAAAGADRLKLDKGKAASAAGPLLEDKVAKDRAAKESAARVDELNRNLEALKKLQAASAPKPAASTAQPGPAKVAPAASVAAAPASVPASAPVAVKPSVAAASAAAPAPVVAASQPASAVAVTPAASEAALASAPQAATPPVVAAASAASVPAAVKVPVVADEEEKSFIESLSDNPMVLPAAGLALAGLAALGWYRLRGRNKEEAGVTSFLESRLQPDSFFGASGGQRVDTRDASGAPSSMSYSLSQIDAIGDVDPVAEADVYLAYGRDLQAEEILKEAMRANPDRLAIRTKLLEVYAKRRDTKGYELLAGELYGLTGGQGEDWQRAQELGRSIDPENPLYEPGGQPSSGSSAEAGAGEMLGASTMPQSVVPSPSRYESVAPDLDLDSGPVTGSSMEMDLDISVPGPMEDAVSTSGGFLSSASGADLSVPDSLPGSDTALGALDFELNDLPGDTGPAPATAPGGIDLGGISLDLDEPMSAPVPAFVDAPTTSGGALTGLDGADDDDVDPLARKMELAEEFHQIGDLEGARDLLLEVIDGADGALKAKAQTMLDNLS
jgi:pilus assembly protein FimV